MDSIGIFASMSKRENFEVTKFVSKKKIKEFIENLDKEMNFDILPLIKKVISREAKSFSLSRENPHRYIFVSNGSDTISISLRALGKQTKVLIPKAVFEV